MSCSIETLATECLTKIVTYRVSSFQPMATATTATTFQTSTTPIGSTRCRQNGTTSSTPDVARALGTLPRHRSSRDARHCAAESRCGCSRPGCDADVTLSARRVDEETSSCCDSLSLKRARRRRRRTGGSRCSRFEAGSTERRAC